MDTGNSDQVLTPKTALKAARYLLDGGSEVWVARRLSLSLAQVAESWSFAVQQIASHQARSGVSIEDPAEYARQHPDTALRLLLSWEDQLSLPEIATSPPEPTGGDELEHKKNADQGEAE